MAQVGSLVIDLIAETASFNANIQRASRQLNSEATRMNQSLASINKGIGSVIDASKALAGAAIVGEIANLAKRGLDYASSLGEVSEQLGVTSEDLQIYRYAATQVGLSQDEMDRGLQRLTRTLGEAQLGSKKAGEVFEALGVDIRTASGAMKTTGEIIPEISQALSKIPDPARRAAVETQLFGKAGQQLDTLLAGGSGAIDELRNAAHNLGIVLSDQEIQRADQTADKLAEVKTVLEARIARVVSENANAVYQFADGLGYAATKAGNFITMMDDILTGADKIKEREGYLKFLFTPISDMRALGAADRRLNSLPMVPIEGLRFNARTPLQNGGPDIDKLLAGGGSGSRSRSARAIREVKTEADKLNESLAELRDQNNGMLENISLPYQIGGADDPLMKALKIEAFYKELRELSTVNTAVTKEISMGWKEAADDVLGSLQSLAYGIQNGNFLSIFGGVLELLMGLGGAGVFGSKIATNINGSKGFASGGYTGSAGVDEIAGFVHGKEYVFDAQAVRRIGIENLERLRKGYKNGGYVGTMPAAMSRMTPANRVSFDLRGAVMTSDLLMQMQQMAAGAAMRGAAAGSEDAQRSMASRARRRIPRGF
jgi:hypothetical protein